jgi:hypothetical protein
VAAAAAAFAIAGIVGVSVAQTDPDADVYVTYKLNSWTVAPAITNSTVKGFLAYADETSIVGSNISVVWYQREDDGSWTTWAWSTYDLTDATIYVRALYNDDLIFEDEPVLSVAAWNLPAAGSQPKQVVNGLFFDDPVQPLVEGSSEPQTLVSTLVDIGWEAAPDLSPLAVAEPEVCDPSQPPKDPVKALMDEYVYKTEVRLFGSSSEVLECVPLGCAGCEHIERSKTPAPGSVWTFHHSVVLPDGTIVCYYDRPARIYWHEEGLSRWLCHVCNDSGYTDTMMHTKTTTPPGGSGCTPPPA